MATDHAQDKNKEIAFFDAHAGHDAYDVFTPQANERLISAFVRLTGLPRGARVADLGCGSGVFTELLRRAGYASVGTISPTRDGLPARSAASSRPADVSSPSIPTA